MMHFSRGLCRNICLMFNPTIFSTSLLRTYCRIGPDEAIFLDGVTLHLCYPASRSLYSTLLHVLLFFSTYAATSVHLCRPPPAIWVSPDLSVGVSISYRSRNQRTGARHGLSNASQVSIPCTRRKRLCKLMPDHSDRLSFQSLQSEPL